MTHIIKSTKNYELSVGSAVGSNSTTRAYQVINKNYGVIEIETFLLPQALKHMRDLEAALDAQNDIESEGSK